MPRGTGTLGRAAACVCALALVVQCGGSQAASVDSIVSPTVPATSSTVESSTTTVLDTAIDSPTSTTEPATSAPATSIPATSIPATSTPATTVAPTTTTVPPPVIDPRCPLTAHAAVVDRDRQRAWLCDHGVALPEFVVTTARTLPDPGTFPVYAKDMNASSTFGGHDSTMTHFVAFTRGENTGARVAFHTVPVLRDGQYVQPLESVGTEDRHGDSAGCIRVLPQQGQVVWDWLQLGDEVRIVT